MATLSHRAGAELRLQTHWSDRLAQLAIAATLRLDLVVHDLPAETRAHSRMLQIQKAGQRAVAITQHLLALTRRYRHYVKRQSPRPCCWLQRHGERFPQLLRPR